MWAWAHIFHVNCETGEPADAFDLTGAPPEAVLELIRYLNEFTRFTEGLLSHHPDLTDAEHDWALDHGMVGFHGSGWVLERGGIDPTSGVRIKGHP